MSDMDDLLDFEDGGIDFPTNENYDLTTASTTIGNIIDDKMFDLDEKITKIEVATEDKSGDDNETLVKQDTFDFDNLEEFNINDSDFLKKKISESLENNSLENKNIDNDNNNDNSDNIDESLLKKDDGDIKSSKNLKSSEKEEATNQQQLLANQNAQNFRGRNLRKNNDWRQPNLNAGAFLNGVMSPFRPGFAPGQMIGPNIHVNPNFARLRPHVLPFGNPLMQYPGGPHMNMLPYQGQMEIPQYHPSMNPMAGRVARRQMNSSPSGANQQQRHPSSQSQTSSSSSPSKRKFPDNGFEQKESDNKRSSTSNNNSLIPEYYNERKGTLYWYDMLVRRMEIAGPTFIKLAQWAASRTDIFPQEMCLRLSKLHSAVDPHPFEFTKKIIEKFFNEPLEQVFSEFDQIPIGVGAIAQVFILFFAQRVE
ncbi:21451_t:CDS:2 [Entrophospora sp. SA101]|nr:21451_t:CDS:2 [Entrophospora sp. SA101]